MRAGLAHFEMWATFSCVDGAFTLWAANAGGHFPMLDEIRRHCALLLSEDFPTHSAAYLWLKECRPFRRVLERFREHELSLFEVAACLAACTSRPLTPLALSMLAEEVGRQENGVRETTPL